MRIGISPLATHLSSCAREISVQVFGFDFEGNFLHPEPVMSPVFIGNSPSLATKYFIKDSKCCVASISVGAIYATCKFPKFCLPFF